MAGNERAQMGAITVFDQVQSGVLELSIVLSYHLNTVLLAAVTYLM